MSNIKIRMNRLAEVTHISLDLQRNDHWLGTAYSIGGGVIKESKGDTPQEALENLLRYKVN